MTTEEEYYALLWDIPPRPSTAVTAVTAATAATATTAATSIAIVQQPKFGP